MPVDSNTRSDSVGQVHRLTEREKVEMQDASLAEHAAFEKLYSSEELAILRKQKARSNKRAQAAAKKRGYQKNPRLSELYANMEKTQPGGDEYVSQCQNVGDDL